jgi:hypothetical protein
MVYTKLPSEDVDLEQQAVTSLPTEELPPYPSSETTTTTPPPSAELNHDHESLLALAQTHQLTASDVQFLASHPNFATPEQKAKNARASKIVGCIIAIFVTFWCAGVIAMIVSGVVGF